MSNPTRPARGAAGDAGAKRWAQAPEHLRIQYLQAMGEYHDLLQTGAPQREIEAAEETLHYWQDEMNKH